MLPISLTIFKYCSNLKFDYQEINDEVALYKLRKIYLISYEQDVEDYCLYFTYGDTDYHLSLVNNRLILQPGTQIFLEDIDSIFFYEEDNCIKLTYQRGNKMYEKIIGPQERIHIDDFSSSDDVEYESFDSLLLSSE